MWLTDQTEVSREDRIYLFLWHLRTCAIPPEILPFFSRWQTKQKDWRDVFPPDIVLVFPSVTSLSQCRNTRFLEGIKNKKIRLLLETTRLQPMWVRYSRQRTYGLSCRILWGNGTDESWSTVLKAPLLLWRSPGRAWTFESAQPQRQGPTTWLAHTITSVP